MIAIVVSEFNRSITNGLLDGCLEAFKKGDFSLDQISIEYVPGAFELPSAVLRLCNNPENQIVVALGCVVKGETDHYHYICEAVSKGMMDVSLKVITPTLFGILTCQNMELAIARSGNNLDKNKGYEVGESAVWLLEKRSLKE
ncbi:MAG: 6,7-dimethyl-8-ribityllumazine synthase [Candidatus Marinimicrobia bacterium]|nr:6,7-dimethyl-8-ribityllumazine synthase [Candidatus Neomarinimicrobiota bacterium]|tara:strand:+ start:7753 stop:8181 length:429 start_codon:yes stop_codon:yes gene_type:complete